MNIFITAGNRGIGLEFVRQLLERGDHVTTTARNPGEADELQALADEHPDRLQVLELDVTDPETVAAAAEAVGERPIDLLINNAGRLSRGGSPDDFDFDQIEADFQVNTVGTLRVIEAMLPHVRRSEENPKIVNVTSKMGSISDNGSGGSYAYRMSKCALNMATRSLAADLADDGIVTFVMHPGWVQTRMGGPNALITTEKSVTNMLEVIDGAGPDDSGEFYEWNGNRVPW
ncbi:SDR family oxidoreductase [Persicimonas caeni]|uniref:SDR family oxidoreductase n=1 Tax=Persicimonas caeni TaxID=2292766 RepID=A0A4Y6PPZ2_PERCE|nr:SDR family oxidoreductase [Persicimonas caeni]QDG50350.1 SDR family oxidoreductase [Persicimonas caeni]QED31571.1 SDR family oxidoreductase [Persicimonas caeni]